MKTLLFLALLLIAQDETVTKVVSGRMIVDDGSSLPTVHTFRGPNVQFGLQASVPGIPGRVAAATMNPDGLFSLPLVLAGGTGEFAINATMVPLGYYVKSIDYGQADLLRSTLLLTPTSGAAEMRIVLTKVPPSGTTSFKVSGRVTNWAANSGAAVVVSLQSTSTAGNGVSVLRIGNTTVNADGTFEISGVPPGSYSGRTPPDPRELLVFNVVDRDVNGLEATLNPGAPSIIITTVPFRPVGTAIRPSPLEVTGPSAPLVPPRGLAIVSIAQSGRYERKLYEGALSFFRIERLASQIEEKRLESTPLTFTIGPGDYELRSYSRVCDGNCGSLGPPEFQCTLPLTLNAGQVLYAERVLQNGACTIRLNPAPQ